MDRPYSPACDRNKDPILQVLKSVIRAEDKILFEIGSGTGQHAVYLAAHFPHVLWQTSDLMENHEGIRAWLNDYKGNNLAVPLEFKVGKSALPDLSIDIVFTANTLHIISWSECLTLFSILSDLKAGSRFLVYGPFKHEGHFTSESNAQFDLSLREYNPLSGIRDFEAVREELIKSGFELLKDFDMPAYNQFLVFLKVS